MKDVSGRHGKKGLLILSNESRISGAEMSLLSLLENLPPDKYRIIVVLPEKGPLYDRLMGSHRIALYPLKKIPRERNVLRALGNLATVVTTGIRIAAFARKEAVDVVYSNSIQAQLYGLVIRLFSFKKIIWHVRDRNPGSFVSRCCAFASTRIICISTFIYDQTPGAGKKKKLIYNGLDTGFWAPVPKKAGLPGLPVLPAGTLVVGQVGQLIPWKNHVNLVEAARLTVRSFPLVHFLILGEDMTNNHEDYVRQLKDHIRAAGLDDYFTFAGFRRDIKEYINQLDILVHCAEGEPFGRVILEGMALEKAVIAYRSGGCAEMIADGVSGILVEPRRVEQLSAALVELLRDDERRASLGKQARETVIGRFSIADSVRQFQAVIDGI